MEWKQLPTHFSHFYDGLDRHRPYETILTGGYRGTLSLAEGERPYWLYFPPGMEYSCRHLVVLVPGSLDMDEFLARTGWQALADREGLMLILAGSALSPWQGDASDDSMLDALETLRGDRTYMDTQRATGYLACYEEATAPGHRYLLRHPDHYASAALFGARPEEDAVLAAAALLPSNAPDVPLGTVACPICFVGDPPPALVDHWRRANRTEPLPYAQRGATIYLPDPAILGSHIDHQPVARVMVLPTLDLYDPDITRRAWYDLLARTVRGTGALNHDLHPYRTPGQWELQRRQLQLDGWTRHWHEYRPDRPQVLSGGAIPLVVFLHGGSASGLSGLHCHEWVTVAKERGFALALPTGTMRRFDTMMPHPAWNASRADDHMDDEGFLRAMVADICERMPIDRSRIYVCGHSMGAAMSQRAALAMSDLFAAACSNSGVITGGFMGDLDTPGLRTDRTIPIWIQMGEKDVGGGTLENNPKALRTVSYWLDRYGLGPVDDPLSWRTGRYLHKQWQTPGGTPLVRYTTTLEKPHANSPQDAWFYYDQFFCCFSRREDGTLLYLGRPV